jgi:phage terminase large subunit-like protein
LLATCPPWNRPRYEPSKRRVTWPNGAIATLYSADEPDRLRGPQHDGAWCDELGVWRYPEAFDMLMLGLRLGTQPQCVVTTTPKAVPLLKTILNDPTTVVTRGSTYENVANLAAAFRAYILGKYEGTRLGRQELHAELLEDVEGALWQRATLDQNRMAKAPALQRVVVGVDPSTTAGGDEAGIVVVGIDAAKHVYVLDDLSVQGSPDKWAQAAIVAYHRHRANKIVAESNQGGEMVGLTIHAARDGAGVPVTLVHASNGKQARAEPISLIYEQGRAHHVGTFAALEDELCSWVPGGPSPNRLDALVWAVTELTQKPQPNARAV